MTTSASARSIYTPAISAMPSGISVAAVEMYPKDAEAWVGLAASYDRLKRFDLADRAYGQATKLIGDTPELLNNKGYSLLLRGDYARAKTVLLRAQA